MADQLRLPIPQVKEALLTFPAPKVVLITLNRPTKLNSLNAQLSADLATIWPWFDAEPGLLVAVVTGAGRAFCAGADLHAWKDRQAGAGSPLPKYSKEESARYMLTRRKGKKPVIAAVNGLAHGGGCEMITNCDLVVAAETAELCLPEVKRGVSPYAGALPRLIRTLGLQRASELALTGRPVTAQEAFTWGLVNRVVPLKDVVPEAVKLASMIAANSPDSVICTRAGLREGWYQADVEDAVQKTQDEEWTQLQKGENILEGLKAFAERRPPQWKASRL